MKPLVNMTSDKESLSEPLQQLAASLREESGLINRSILSEESSCSSPGTPGDGPLFPPWGGGMVISRRQEALVTFFPLTAQAIFNSLNLV